MLWYICWKHKHRLKIQLRTLFLAVKHICYNFFHWTCEKYQRQHSSKLTSYLSALCSVSLKHWGKNSTKEEVWGLRKGATGRKDWGMTIIQELDWEWVCWRHGSKSWIGMDGGSQERVSIHRWSTVGCCSAGAVGDLCETWSWWRTVPSTVQEQLDSVCISIFKHWDQTCVLHQSPSTERWFDLE